MKAKIKRLLILILICSLICNSNMAYLAMGIDMLFVNATESTEDGLLDDAEDTTDDEINDSTDDISGDTSKIGRAHV